MQTLPHTTRQPTLQIIDCGLAPYRQVLQNQLQLHKQIVNRQKQNTVLIAEHTPVITLGARKNANKLLVSRADLDKKQIEVVQTRRGGGTTAHNPGQLVFYPILNLRKIGLDVNQYIRTLETIGAELLERFGIESTRRKNAPGLWTNNRKIASVGVRVSRSVTCHGMAINIRNNLGIFDSFVPCGLDGVQMTSVLKETGKPRSMKRARQILTDLLIEHFSLKKQPTKNQPRKLPPWLRRPLPAGPTYRRTENVLNSLNLHTICTDANCPNRGQCWERATAAVLILGTACTRNCRFCSVPKGRPAPPDTAEPERIAQMVRRMNLKYLVITSVTRDDLPDGGAAHFRDCIRHVRRRQPSVKFEILAPDFKNCQTLALETLAQVTPFVFAHNIETVPSLYPSARPGADYHASLDLLKTAKKILGNIPTKSSIMLGLGETDAEVEQTLRHLRNAACDRITIGQYLKPSANCLEVVEYIPPEKFDFWKQKSRRLGFSSIHSEPFARTSYAPKKIRAYQTLSSRA